MTFDFPIFKGVGGSGWAVPGLVRFVLVSPREAWLTVAQWDAATIQAVRWRVIVLRDDAQKGIYAVQLTNSPRSGCFVSRFREVIN